jgi:hypothetical protein
MRSTSVTALALSGSGLVWQHPVAPQRGHATSLCSQAQLPPRAGIEEATICLAPTDAVGARACPLARGATCRPLRRRRPSQQHPIDHRMGKPIAQQIHSDAPSPPSSKGLLLLIKGPCTLHRWTLLLQCHGMWIDRGMRPHSSHPALQQPVSG